MICDEQTIFEQHDRSEMGDLGLYFDKVRSVYKKKAVFSGNYSGKGKVLISNKKIEDIPIDIQQKKRSVSLADGYFRDEECVPPDEYTDITLTKGLPDDFSWTHISHFDIRVEDI